MNVRVVPKRPIPGILPKNKWIDVEMELDLNIMEIRRCMQYGNVYYDGQIINETKLALLATGLIKPEKKIELHEHIIDTTEILELEVEKPKNDDSLDSLMTIITPVFKQMPETVIVSEPNNVEEIIESVITEYQNEIEVINELKEISCVREDNNYIILELQFNSNTNFENVMGMFKINSGSKVEYKSDNDKWVKFNHKFNTFSELGNDTKFVFRFNPSHKSLLKYHLTLKQEKENGFEVNLDGTIDQGKI